MRPCAVCGSTDYLTTDAWCFVNGPACMLILGHWDAIIQMPRDAVNIRGAANLLGRSAMPTIASLRYYVYVLVRSTTNKPFYVGKGSGRRINEHEREAGTDCRCRKCHTIRKVWRQGGQVVRYIMLETNDEQEALDYEIELIALYGRKNLCNLTDGGDGVRGAVVSDELRAKRSANQKARWQDPEYRAKQKARLPKTPDQRAATSQRLKGRVFSEETRQKLAQRARERWARPGERAQQGARSRENWIDPSFRANAITRLEERWSDPDVRERQRDALLEQWKNPARRARHSTIMKAAQTPEVRTKQRNAHLDPDERERNRSVSKAHWADPEARVKHIAGMKASWARRKAKQQDKEDTA